MCIPKRGVWGSGTTLFSLRIVLSIVHTVYIYLLTYTSPWLIRLTMSHCMTILFNCTFPVLVKYFNKKHWNKKKLCILLHYLCNYSILDKWSFCSTWLRWTKKISATLHTYSTIYKEYIVFMLYILQLHCYSLKLQLKAQCATS